MSVIDVSKFSYYLLPFYLKFSLIGQCGFPNILKSERTLYDTAREYKKIKDMSTGVIYRLTELTSSHDTLLAAFHFSVINTLRELSYLNRKKYLHTNY